MNESPYPLVSIILPTYNRQHLLERSVTSVLRQTYPHWELHIIDDGSTDGTMTSLHSQVLSWKRQIQSFGRFPKSIHIHQTEHRGVSCARNFGLHKASGEWVSFLDSDDEWFPEKLNKQIQFHKDHREFHFSQTKEVWNKKGNLLEPKGKFQKVSGHFLSESLALCMVTCSSFLAKKETLERVGGFREEMKTCEDYDLWNRILLKGYGIGLLPENLLVRYGGHEDQLSNQYQAMERFRLYSLLSIHKEEHSSTNTRNETNALDLLEEAILFRFDTLLQGREKRGKDVRFLKEMKQTFLKNQPIPKEELLQLLDDVRFEG